MEKKFIDFALHMELSDLIFDHHMKSYMTLNMVIIGIQFIGLIFSVITRLLFNLKFSTYMCVVNLVLCVIVVINNLIHEHTWKKAKKRAETIYKGIEYLCTDDLESEEGQLKYHHFMKALVPNGYHAKHMANSNKNDV